MKMIEILVAPTGETTVATRGFTGGTCREASRFLEQALGRKTGERVSPEFYQSAESQLKNRQQN